MRFLGVSQEDVSSLHLGVSWEIPLILYQHPILPDPRLPIPDPSSHSGGIAGSSADALQGHGPPKFLCDSHYCHQKAGMHHLENEKVFKLLGVSWEIVSEPPISSSQIPQNYALPRGYRGKSWGDRRKFWRYRGKQLGVSQEIVGGIVGRHPRKRGYFSEVIANLLRRNTSI